tara:strand:- start:332 stop:595 length:264 start_codon:yes stop_codon:yes gene_type:complete
MPVKGIFETYAIISIEDINKVDFSQVGETSLDTVRKNFIPTPTEFVLKWNTEPTFITDGTILPIQIYTHTQCLALMQTLEWNGPEPI